MKRSATLAAAALLAIACGVASAADYKIGFVNTERLFREATPAKRAQQKLEKEFANRDGELGKLAKQVRDLQTMLDRENRAVGRLALPTMELFQVMFPAQAPMLDL